MHSRVERLIGHNGTVTRPILLREAAVGNLPQWAQAYETHRVVKKGFARKALLLKKNTYESNCSYVDGI